MAIDNQTLFFPQPQEDENGLTLRDWFAGQALAGVLSNSNMTFERNNEAAEVAYSVADAMLAARSEGVGDGD